MFNCCLFLPSRPFCFFLAKRGLVVKVYDFVARGDPHSVELLHTNITPSMVSSSLTARAGGGAPPFWKTKIIIKLRNTHFQIKGIFDGIRIFVWQTSPTHPNLWLVRFDPMSSVVSLHPLPPRRGDKSRKIGRGCATRFVKPKPYFRPKSVIFPTLFQTWSKIWYPISELTLKSIPQVRPMLNVT